LILKYHNSALVVSTLLIQLITVMQICFVETRLWLRYDIQSSIIYTALQVVTDQLINAILSMTCSCIGTSNCFQCSANNDDDTSLLIDHNVASHRNGKDYEVRSK